MIKEQKPLTYSEVASLVGEGEKAMKVKEFIKEFYPLKEADSKKLKEELEGLGILKLNETHIVNLVNFLPRDSTDLNKIVNDSSLDQEEVTKILDVIKKY